MKQDQSIPMNEPASFSVRLAAFLLDYLIIAAYIVVLTLITALLFNTVLRQAASVIFKTPIFFDLFAFVALVLPVALYFFLMECSPQHATWGKRKRKLRVVSVAGGRVSRFQSLIRSGIKFLPWQIAHTSIFHIPGWPFAVKEIPLGSMIGLAVSLTLAGSYLIMLAFTTDHRPPYDLLSGTQVIINIQAKTAD